MIRVADYIINKIYDEGARDIFTVTGRGILFLSDAAAKHEGMNVISVHHEQAGAYAAMAYAQTNGSIGACLVSTGC
ncbi:MAG: thiamine pyrophosphate-binding protein, partial [Coprococcus sp.]